MSEYTTAKSIQGYYMGLDLDKSDYITKTQVKTWIKEYSVKIDISLRRKYNLPITEADDLVFLKMLCEKFVVGRMDEILRNSVDEEDKKYIRNRNYTKDANNELQSLVDGSLQLITAPKCLAPIGYLQGDY